MKNKRFIKVISMQAQFKLRFRERWAYACLVNQTSKGRGLTMGRLATLTGFNRTRDIPTVLRTLESNKLATSQDNKWFAAQPTPGQAIYDAKSDKPHWWERLCYNKVYARAKGCPLTPVQNAIYFLLAQKKPIRLRALLVSILGIDRSTARRALRKLEVLGLIDLFRHPLPLDADKLKWWSNDEKKINKEKGWKETTEIFQSVLHKLINQFPHIGWSEIWHDIVQTCQQLDYKANQVEVVLANALNAIEYLTPIGELLRQVPSIIKLAEDNTERNRKLGTFHGSSFGAFKAKIQDWVDGQTKKAAS